MTVKLLNRKKGAAPKALISQAADFIERVLIEKQILPAPLTKNLVIVFLSPDLMRKLNKKFLDKNKTTDILAFAPVEEKDLGELALCQEQIKIQAKDHGLSLEEETVYLITHGILHLLGYRHEEGEEEARIMYETQDSIFSLWQDSRREKSANGA